MMNKIAYKRYYPKGFFTSKGFGIDDSSISEQFARAVISIALNIEENEIIRGDPLKSQPDYIMKKSHGFEVAFACRRDKENNIILRINKGNYKVNDLENDTIISISESIKKKSEKKVKGNYSGVNLFIICLDPLFYWYPELFDFKI